MNTKILITIGILWLVLLTIGVLDNGKTVDNGKPTGAVSGPDIMSPYFSFGGVRFWANRSDSLVAATTTPYNAQSPVATSTLIYGGCNFSTSSTTAMVVTFAKSASPNATTTALGSTTIAANAKGTVVASTTPASYTGIALDPTLVFAPSQWFVMSMTGGGGTFSPTGSCNAVWMQL